MVGEATGDGDSVGAIEPKLDETFSRIVEEGEARLGRRVSAMFVTGAMAGVEVGLGVLALLVVDERTKDPLLGAIAFSIGFLALVLGHSELFTEGFLVPVMTVAARRAPLDSLARLWLLTLLGNLLAGWLVTWLFATGFPTLAHEALTTATPFIDAGMGPRSIALGLLAGAAMTLMTRMQHGTESVPARLAASVAIAFAVSGFPLFHSILDSLVIFTALHEGQAPFGYLDWLGWLGWAVLWNVIGGVGLVTLMRIVRSRERLAQERRDHAA